MTAWLWGVCIFQAALIFARTLELLRVNSPFWAIALPGYLPTPLGTGSLIAPALLLAVWIAALARPALKSGNGSIKPFTAFPWTALLLPMLVLALPDRAGFMGDYLIRKGAVLAHNYGATFPQSLPLDRWIQETLAPALGADPAVRSLQGARWLGVMACIATTVLGARAIRASGLSRPWSDLAALILGGAAYVCVFTGIVRDTVEFLPVSLLLLSSLHKRLHDQTQWSPIPELAMSCLLVLHRSAVCMFPVYLYATFTSATARRSGSRQSRNWWIGATMLGITAAIMIPRILRLGLSFDLPMNAEWVVSGRWEGNALADPTQLWDLLNAIVMLAPAAPFALIVSGFLGRAERGFCLSCIAGWLPMMLLVRPHQGAFRDYDAYACVALTLTYCVVLGFASGTADRSRVGRWALVLTAISTLQATLGLLFVSSTASFTEARVRHGIMLAKSTQQREKSLMHEYLGVNAERRGLWKEAASRFSAAATLTPAPVRIVRAGRASAYANDWPGAREWFGKLIARDSSSVIGWCGYSAAAWMVGDTALAQASDDRLAELCKSPKGRLVASRFIAYSPILDVSGRLSEIVHERP